MGTNTDVDMFSFTVAAEDTYRIAVNGDAVAPNLDAVLELRNSAGSLIGSANPPDTLNAEIRKGLAPGNLFSGRQELRGPTAGSASTASTSIRRPHCQATTTTTMSSTRPTTLLWRDGSSTRSWFHLTTSAVHSAVVELHAATQRQDVGDGVRHAPLLV